MLGISIIAMTIYLRNNPLRQNSQSPLLVPVSAESLPSVISLPVTNTVTSDSPDGTWTLTVKKQTVNNITTHSILVLNKADTSETMIFSKIEQSTQDLSIPFNSWSPDNKYVFVKESTPTVTNYLVFSTSGQPFNTKTPFVNVYDLFVQKYPEYIFEDITGWAAPYLLIVNSHKTAGDSGTSFWFDVSSQTFTLLSTHFD